MLSNQNSNSYSTQGWLAQIYSVLEGGIGLGLVNGTIINGTAFFVTDTKPTTRIGGGALVAGDKWYKTDDGTEWFWNGSYWLSTNFVDTYHQGTATATTYSGRTAFISLDDPNNNSRYPYFIEKLKLRYYLATADASNYWDVRLLYGTMSTDGTNTFFTEGLDGTIFSFTTSGTYILEHDYNLYRNGTSSTYDHGFFMEKVGSPSNLLFSAVLRLRNVI